MPPCPVLLLLLPGPDLPSRRVLRASSLRMPGRVGDSSGSKRVTGHWVASCNSKDGLRSASTTNEGDQKSGRGEERLRRRQIIDSYVLGGLSKRIDGVLGRHYVQEICTVGRVRSIFSL